MLRRNMRRNGWDFFFFFGVLSPQARPSGVVLAREWIRPELDKSRVANLVSEIADKNRSKKKGFKGLLCTSTQVSVVSYGG